MKKALPWPMLLLAVLISLPLPSTAEEELVMGVFPRRTASLTSELFSPLARYLSDKLDRPVRLVTAKDFRTFWAGVEDESYDIVHYNQFHYIQSSNLYTVVASNEEQGNSTIAGAIYVRKDSGIDNIGQLRGQTIIFGGGPDAMMSYIVPRYLLQQAGLYSRDYHTAFASNPLNAVLAVYFEQARAGGAGDVVMNLPKVKSIAKGDKLKYLAVSEPIAHLPWAVKKDMPETLRQRIQRLMVELKNTDEGRQILKTARLTGLKAATDNDYDSSREIIRKVMPDSEQ